MTRLYVDLHPKSNCKLKGRKGKKKQFFFFHKWSKLLFQSLLI